MAQSLGRPCFALMTTIKNPDTAEPALPDRARTLWSQIAQEIAQAIGAGSYPPGKRLPSEQALAERFGVNRHTIRRSLSELGQRGLVRATQGSGTYVEEFAVDLALGKRTRHRESLSRTGLSGSIRVLEQTIERASESVARALEVRKGSRVLHLLVLGDANGQPLHFSDRYFPLPRFSGLGEHLHATGSITQSFAVLGVLDYTRKTSRISARLPDSTIATHLRQSNTRPTLFVTSVNIDVDGCPIEYALTWFAGDRVSFTVGADDA